MRKVTQTVVLLGFLLGGLPRYQTDIYVVAANKAIQIGYLLIGKPPHGRWSPIQKRE